MEIDITKISSKGQIVIPASMRSDFKKGERFIILKDKDRIILKKAIKADQQFKEDFEFAKRTEEALKRIESGDYVSVDSKNLYEKMMKW